MYSSSSSSSSRLSSSSDLNDIFQDLVQENTNRSPMLMCTTDEAEKIKSSDYFFSMVELVNKNPEREFSLRPKKFKHLKNLARADDEYQVLAKEKKINYQILKEKLFSDKLEFFQKVILSSAESGQNFDSLVLPLDRDKNADLFSQLKIAYNSQVEVFSQLQAKRLDFVSFCPMHIFLASQKSKLDETEQSNLYKTYLKLSIIWKDITDRLYMFIKYPHQQFIEWDKKIFCDIIKKKIMSDKMITTEDKNLIRTEIFNHSCQFIHQKMTDHVATEKQISFLQVFFHEHSESIQKRISEVPIDDDFMLIKKILKEQKQHTLTRFCELTTNYENFIRHSKMIEEMACKIEADKGMSVRAIISDLINYSHHSATSREQISCLQTKKDAKSHKKVAQLIEEINHITVEDTHHQPDIMGYESKKYHENEKQNTIEKLNLLFQIHEKKEMIKTLQRAHTFPFPAMFNWKEEKIQELISNQGIEIRDSFQPLNKYITAAFFKKIRTEKNSTDFLNAAFRNELEIIKQDTMNDCGQFIYKSLILLKQYHLRVFSEAEMVPDFINAELDPLSEWKTPEENYQKNIADSIVQLLDKPEVTQEDVANSLNKYKAETKIRVVKKSNALLQDQTIFNLVKMIGAIQMNQACTISSLKDVNQIVQIA